MCGICGRTVDPDGIAVAAMNRALHLRGPDDEGIYVDSASGLALGARRLSIIDVAGGHQPLSNEEGDVWAVLNGEIYNHPSLQRHLHLRGHRLATGTDTEVLVHLYEEYGDDLVHALEGMFAFAVWDERRRRLLLARDRFGEKPLFYAQSSGVLSFASELTALCEGGDVDGELDTSALDAFFVFGYVPGSRVILRGVRQLPPGHVLTWEPGGAQPTARPYWWPPPSAPGPRERLPELIAETRRLLEGSVRSRMIADVPVGVFLSGGVDSTLIAALAAQHSSSPIKTFTVGYDVGAVSEAETARATAVALGAEHRELVLTTADVATRVPALLAGLDQPLADQALPALHAVAELARQEVTVAIGGEGADELFGGYPRYRWLERAAGLEQHVPPFLGAQAMHALNAAPGAGRTRRLGYLFDRRPLLERHLDWVTERRRELRMDLYGPRLAAEAETERALDDLTARADGRPATPVPAALMRLDQLHWLPDDVLVKADRAGMRVSLEIRTPYLHRELAEFAATVAPGVHVQGRGKALLRALLSEVLPGAGGRRPKTAFRVPAAHWLRGPLAPVLARQLAEGALYAEGWIDATAAQGLAGEHGAGTRDWSHVLWPLLSLGLWLDRRRGIDAP
ncbi:MAG: asparagine synthase (glutamine-hydrolyzing) [Actinomycetota bacterium]|nr:asparagine synthase (glutamine-hydrolyzing) [Actinomycetota bacterium]